MADERVQRRLAAILAADVAGYSHLMELDEERTHRVFQTCHAKITKIVSGYGGRVFDGHEKLRGGCWHSRQRAYYRAARMLIRRSESQSYRV